VVGFDGALVVLRGVPGVAKVLTGITPQSLLGAKGEPVKNLQFELTEKLMDVERASLHAARHAGGSTSEVRYRQPPSSPAAAAVARVPAPSPRCGTCVTRGPCQMRPSAPPC
jgi:hypothetical protein